MDYCHSLTTQGFAVISSVIDSCAVSRLRTEFQSIHETAAVRQRNGSTFGVRDVLKLVPFVRSVAHSHEITSVVSDLTGRPTRLVRSLFFDKTPEANWKVLWHQDLTIAVREQRSTEGFGPWTIKAGIPHVQPPPRILENILTLRIHLDDADESNGALQLIPGSHARGRLSADGIRAIATSGKPALCKVSAGDVVAMRPLIVHCSRSGAAPHRRRVLHLEFSPDDLPGGLNWYES